MTARPKPPTRGTLAVDTRTGRVGEVMGTNPLGTVAYLRPPHGGTEWEAPMAQVREATAGDRAQHAAAEFNRRRRGLQW